MCSYDIMEMAIFYRVGKLEEMLEQVFDEDHGLEEVSRVPSVTRFEGRVIAFARQLRSTRIETSLTWVRAVTGEA